MKKQFLLLLLGLALTAHVCAKLAAESPLSEEQIKNEFSGLIISDGHHWSILLNPNGSAKAFMMGKARQGAWKIEKKQFCMAVPSGASFDCWMVFKRDQKFSFNAFGKDQFEVTVQEPSSQHQLD